MSRALLISVLAVVLFVAQTAAAIKLRGLTSNTYRDGEPIAVRVNSLTSSSRIMPMPWYSLPWCQMPPEEIKAHKQRMNLGEILWGDQVEPSLFEFEVLTNITCSSLCVKSMKYKDKELLTKRIEENYRGNLILDNLPVAEEGSGSRSRFSKVVTTGFPIGIPKRRSGMGRTVVFNHLEFSVFYKEADAIVEEEDTFRIVGFQVSPMSIDFTDVECGPKFSHEAGGSPVFSTDDTIRWTYSVHWYPSDVEWSTRWDIYLKASPMENRIHWFSIINSLIIVIVLSIFIAFVLLRALRRDLARYNDPEAIQEDRDESGWKLVHGDVFRKPERAGLLSVFVGSGVQLIGMTSVTILFAALGFLSPANRGSLLTALIVTFVLLGSANGYVTARLAKYFKMRSWRIIFVTAIFFPGQIFLGYFLLNFVHWGNKASSATPIVSMITLIALWTFVSLPLVLVGGGLGYRAPEITVPVKVNNIPRTVPPQPWYVQFPASVILPGFLPFGAAFIESVLILSSVWQGRVYYVFGFLALVFGMVLLTAAEATIVLIYVQLVNLEYRWWWRSFIAAGSYGIWLMGYSVLYYLIVLSIRSWWSSVLYFGYMAMASYFCFVLIGSFGFLLTFLFVRTIYGSIKID